MKVCVAFDRALIRTPYSQNSLKRIGADHHIAKPDDVNLNGIRCGLGPFAIARSASNGPRDANLWP